MKVKKEREMNIGIKCEMEFDDMSVLGARFEKNHAMALRLPPMPPLVNSIANIQRQVFEDKLASVETFLNNM